MEEHLLAGNFTQAITKCFIESKANAFESLLEPLQKLLRLSPPVALSLAQPELFSRILQKLSSNKALTRLNLLRIVQCICDASDEQGALISMYGLYDTVQRLADNDTAILVRDMASKLIRSCDEHEMITRSGGRRRGARRTSSSTTPPSMTSSGQSMPPTPTSSRSSHSTTYFMDRERIRNMNMNSSIPYRPREDSRSGTPTSQASGTPTTASRSRLPRTTSGRNSRQSMLLSTPKKNDSLSGHTIHRSSQAAPPPVMIPNSRRRRQTSGGGDSRWS